MNQATLFTACLALFALPSALGLMCSSCIANATMFCDNPVDYTTMNCSENVPCFTTTVMTSINQPAYVLGCADITCSVALNMTVCLTAKSIDPGLKSCETTCCNHTNSCNGPTMMTTPAPTSVPGALGLMCLSCIPNTTVVPPVFCDNPVDYATVNCSENVPCFNATVMTSINQPAYVLGCADTTNCSSELNMTVCSQAKSIDPNLHSCDTTCCNKTTNCNTPEPRHQNPATRTPPTTLSVRTTTSPATTSGPAGIICYSCTPDQASNRMCTSPEDLKEIDCAKETIPDGVPEGLTFDACATTLLGINVMNSFQIEAYAMSCAIKVASSDPSGVNCSLTEAKVCSDARATVASNPQVTITSCSSICCTTNKCNVKDLTPPTSPELEAPFTTAATQGTD